MSLNTNSIGSMYKSEGKTVFTPACTHPESQLSSRSRTGRAKLVVRRSQLCKPIWLGFLYCRFRFSADRNGLGAAADVRKRRGLAWQGSSWSCVSRSSVPLSPPALLPHLKLHITDSDIYCAICTVICTIYWTVDTASLYSSCYIRICPKSRPTGPSVFLEHWYRQKLHYRRWLN